MCETITANPATGVQPRTGNWATRGTVAAGRGIALVGLTLVGLMLWLCWREAIASARASRPQAGPDGLIDVRGN